MPLPARIRKSEISRRAFVRQQLAAVHAFVVAGNYDQRGQEIGVRLKQDGAFTETETFKAAVTRARVEKADLVMANIREILERTPTTKIVDCVKVLEELDVETWDACRRATWRSLPPEERLGIIRDAACWGNISRKVARSSANRTREPRAKVNGGNSVIGSRYNMARADRHAEKLRPVVDQQREQATNGVLSPTALAKALNAQGRKTRQGKSWSPNAAKNLMKRLDKLLQAPILSPPAD
ncbi:hypothetical protein GRZ55_22480 [Chelativorans sp. ZYF759]|uniref:hypothetical protein n=1 Tax=Chelativorans sp. ZYF759 TaxID=2692213 RepID=UPI00145E8C3F|nr:hypothetical protein [Chelativorans sp. ZYF759]NMG41999.1 hypothetical protein [Chelativorans sp. ZYF759]